MNPIVFQHGHATAFTHWVDVVSPVGEPLARTRVAFDQHLPSEGVGLGIWECTPGKWRRQVTKREFSHILDGHCTFTPDGQPPIELRAGDSVYFPANCNGVWDIHQTVRKSYLIVD